MYIVLALLALGFLIFIHELGHYLAARWVGMRVETFSIGFGKPLFSWKRHGVDWRICWLPFGGYVRMAGMEEENGVDPHDIPDGFFGKKPLDRIKVAIAGPLVNLVFALLIFLGLWCSGGREKTFAEYTHTIGWVDPTSELYSKGIRPGDQITHYNQRRYYSFKDHLYAAMFSDDQVRVRGYHVDPNTGIKTAFDEKVATYQHPAALEDGVKTTGILSPASYIIYDKLPGDTENPLPEGSPMAASGVEYGDRIFWVDGEQIFSREHLAHVINEQRALLTVQRGGSIFVTRVPRIEVGELKLDVEHREELSDWQYEADLGGTRLSKVIYIPYNLDATCGVEGALALIDGEHQAGLTFSDRDSHAQELLRAGDKILAVDGVAVTQSHELLQRLQSHQVHLVVDRSGEARTPVVWTDSDIVFSSSHRASHLASIVNSIGTPSSIEQAGDFVLLKAIQPKRRIEFAVDEEQQSLIKTEFMERKKDLETISNPERRARALSTLERQEKELLLGFLAIQDRKVAYNPGPMRLFVDVFEEIARTLGALVVGNLSPKFMAGPVGIVQVIQTSWMLGIGEVLFWLGAISLNLGILNLMPIPVLDGGYICMALFEMVSGKRLTAKTVERIIVPFAVVIIGLIVFLTFNDLARILRHLF